MVPLAMAMNMFVEVSITLLRPVEPGRVSWLMNVWGLYPAIQTSAGLPDALMNECQALGSSLVTKSCSASGSSGSAGA